MHVKTLSMVACNPGTQEAEPMDLWEFKASLANITNSRTVRFMFQKQYKRQENERCRESQQWQSRKLHLFQNASSSWQSRPRRPRKRQPRTQLPNLLGVDIKLPLPSTPSLEFLMPPGVRPGVFSLSDLWHPLQGTVLSARAGWSSGSAITPGNLL